MSEKAYLFGPFFGEESWEFFRFAPYAIYLKKQNPKHKLIVFTRPSRFDLYGLYADILIPLKIEGESSFKKLAFKLVGFDEIVCKQYEDIFRISYKKKYEIVDHYFPDISPLRYNVKWQFPRDKMDYCFKPRSFNSLFVENYVDFKNKRRPVVLCDIGYNYRSSKYKIVYVQNLLKDLLEVIDNDKITYLGCLIEFIKRCEFVISDLKSNVGHLSILLKKPLIFPNRKMSVDSVMLLNPLKTAIIDCEDINEGVKVYEDNF